MERRAGSGPLGFSERSSTVKEYETLTREKVDVVPFGCGMPETHLMQDWSDRMLDLILNGPTINGIKKDEVRAMLRETYTALKQYEKIGPMASPFINDPTAIVARAFSELYPGVEYVAQYVPDLRDETNGTAYGLTIFPDDGSTPIVCISAEAPISAAPELLAHELAHVATPEDREAARDDHGGTPGPAGSCDHGLRRAGTNGHGRRGDGRADQSPLQGEARELRRRGQGCARERGRGDGRRPDHA